MKFAARIGLYVLLVILAAYFFGRFRSAYRTTPEAHAPLAEATVAVPDEGAAETNVAPAAVGDSAPTNAAPFAAAGDSGTNRLAAQVATQTNVPLPTPVVAPAAPRRSDSLKYLGLFVAFFLALGGLAAWDVSHYLGSRAGRAVMAEDWIERKDPEYEKAEEEWSKGNHLDAISLMREFLAKNPREQHVALRIAEIYEKDLGNYLAAALELQEVLTKRLPRERWGWTAIRLSNIYSGRLKQPDKAMALLERIVNEYSETAAAKKARSRLGIPEPVEATPAASEPEPQPEETPETAASETDPNPPEPPAQSNLPKGFRPKK